MPVLGRSVIGSLMDAAMTSSGARDARMGGAQTAPSALTRYRDSLTDRGCELQTHGGLLAVCANRGCSTGWLHLWRSRRAPVFEGGWTCSADCTEARIEAAVRRELGGAEPGVSPTSGSRDVEGSEDEHPAMSAAIRQGRRHRVPLGLVMLEQKWISQTQLRKALEAQRDAGRGRLGRWLVRHAAVSEELVSRALALQWSCAMLPTSHHDPELMAVTLPRLFVEAFRALPLRLAGGAILYLGFAGRLDPVVALAMQRMLDLQVEPGVLQDTWFHGAHQRMLKASYPRVEIVESQSQAVLARVLTRVIENAKPVEARVVRVHDCLWLRMWLQVQQGSLPALSGIRDVICSLAGN